MKQWMWLAVAAVVVIGAGVSLVALPAEQEWTTSSPEALVEFEKAVVAEKKLYYDAAYRHLTRALELDPDFVIAQLWSLAPNYRYNLDDETAEAIFEEVLAADTSKLTHRERYYVERSRLIRAERREELDPLLDRYLAEYPNDPYLVYQKASQHWNRNESKEAEEYYRRLVGIAPNWVIAYNQLGYSSMGEGRFSEAEEHFKSYRFIAPDQANPHDSLGELFIALGRNDEAEEAFEKAIQIKPDFPAAYKHLAVLKSFNDDIEGARAIIDRAKTAGIPEVWVEEMECLVQYRDLHITGAWEEILDLAEASTCVEKTDLNYAKSITHLAACEIGDWDTALFIEGGAQERMAEFKSKGIDIGDRNMEFLQAAIENLQGVRLALQGDYAEAEELLRAADARLNYMEVDVAILKLQIRMILAELLLATGQDAEAHELVAKVRSVNPVWTAEFQDSGFKMLGLDRG